MDYPNVTLVPGIGLSLQQIWWFDVVGFWVCVCVCVVIAGAAVRSTSNSRDVPVLQVVRTA